MTVGVGIDQSEEGRPWNYRSWSCDGGCGARKRLIQQIQTAGKSVEMNLGEVEVAEMGFHGW